MIAMNPIFAGMEKKYNRIKLVLVGRGVSQKWLADSIGISYNAMSSICGNRAQPRLETLFQIAKALEVDVCDLLEREPAKSPPG